VKAIPQSQLPIVCVEQSRMIVEEKERFFKHLFGTKQLQNYSEN
jgi:hypothetical protein